MVEIKKISEVEYEIPKTGKMNVVGRVFASEKLMKSIKEDETLKQTMNVATLPGLINNVVLCPDAHMGYGMPIGGVVGFDLKEGIMAPGMIGFDINCGIRLLATNISKEEFMKKRKEIIHDLKRTIPSGDRAVLTRAVFPINSSLPVVAWRRCTRTTRLIMKTKTLVIIIETVAISQGLT